MSDSKGTRVRPRGLIQRAETVVTDTGYTFSQVDIALPNHETDVNLVFPNGEKISLQLRLEAPSIDVCMPEHCVVTNWYSEDMRPAFKWKGQPHIHRAMQLVIDFSPKWLKRSVRKRKKRKKSA